MRAECSPGHRLVIGHRFVRRALAFLAALALSGVIGATLLAANAGDTWSLAVAWVAFFVAGAVLVRLEQRHEHRH
jgi:hypothetical protein